MWGLSIMLAGCGQSSTSTEPSTEEKVEEKEKAEREAAEAELFEKFEMLKDNDEFIELKKNASQYDLNTLAEKCYAILGKTTANFSLSGNKQRKFVKFNIRLNEDDKSDNNNPYEELIEKYKKID